MGNKYIDMRLFTDELRTLINASAKIFPMEYEDIANNVNPGNYEYARVVSGPHKREIYHWDNELQEWGLIGADDIDITWDDIDEKPTSYPPKAHQHSENDISDLDKYTREQIDNFLAGKADALHGHNELHEHLNKSILDTITQVLINAWNSAVEHIADLVKHITSEERALWNTVADKANTADVAEALSGKADTGHNHDGRYYTKGETDNKLALKANKFDNRTVLEKIVEELSYDEYDISMLYDLDDRLYAIEHGYTEGHTHSNLTVLNLLDYSGELLLIDLKQIENNSMAIEGKADAVHTHGISDVTGLSTALSGKSAIGHGHTKSDISDFSHQHTESDISDLDKYTKTEVDNALANKANASDVTSALALKADKATLTGHTGNSTIHVTATDKSNWNAKADAEDIPTKTSQLQNDSEFITINDIPAIPTKTSELTNDSGYITADDVPEGFNISIGTQQPADADLWFQEIV